MIDLLLLSLPVLLGHYLSLLLGPGLTVVVIPEAIEPLPWVNDIPHSVGEWEHMNCDAGAWAETEKEVGQAAHKDKLTLARKVIASCADASAKNIAEGLGLPFHSVISLMRGKRRAKRPSDYSRDEIYLLANLGEIL